MGFMGIREIQPEKMAPPAANYAHGVKIENAQTLVFTSGVVPIGPDGVVPTLIEDQAKLVWSNLLEILGTSGLLVTDIASITTYVVASDSLTSDLAIVMAVRDEIMGSHRAASTLVTVPGLARPEWLMEIALIATR